MQAHKIFTYCIFSLLIHLHSYTVYGVERECIRDRFRSQIGVREATGKNDGPEVKKYLASVRLNEGNAWCAAFVNCCLESCGIKTPKSGWVPAWWIKSKVIYESSKVLKIGYEYPRPREGDLIFLYNRSLNRLAHIGFVEKWGDKYVTTVEGNTNDAGSREGNGVYRKIRPVTGIYGVVNLIQ